MRGRNTTVVRVRMPDTLLAMIQMSAALSEKSVTETINGILAEHFHWVDKRWKDQDEAEGEENT